MKIYLIIIISIFTINYSFAQKPEITSNSFPINFSSDDFDKIKKWNNDIIAFDGTIKQEKASRNNTPFY